MDPKIVRMAKEVPARFKSVMEAMFEQSQPALRSGVSTLRESLKKLDSYLSEVEREHLGSTPGRGRPARAAESGEKPVRRRRRKGRFGISEWILNLLSENPKGLRPAEIRDRLVEETGRDKANALSNVNTTLGRLKAMGMAKSADGTWTATGKSAPAAGGAGTGETKRTRKRRGRRKKAAAAVA